MRTFFDLPASVRLELARFKAKGRKQAAAALLAQNDARSDELLRWVNDSPSSAAAAADRILWSRIHQDVTALERAAKYGARDFEHEGDHRFAKGSDVCARCGLSRDGKAEPAKSIYNRKPGKKALQEDDPKAGTSPLKRCV